MALWQFALLVFVGAWILQGVGVWFQTRHYQAVLKDLRTRWSDGALGAGAAASRFGKGVVALLVVSPSGHVRAARAMIGRSVFAKFVEVPELEGLSLETLKSRIESPPFTASGRKAFAGAIEQIEKIRDKNGTSTQDRPSNPQG